MSNKRKLKELKKGEWFTLKEIEYPDMNQVWIKGEYDQSEQKYCCTRWDDINHDKMVAGDKIVYVDFIF